MNEVILHNYFRSSASYRVRIALEMKAIPFRYAAVHLLKDGGEQNSAAYRKLNPMGEVPCLEHGEHVIGQSMAIIEYLDALWPKPRLIPEEPFRAALVRQACENINAGIHPVQNLKVQQELERRFGASTDLKTEWAAYWIARGFENHEKWLAGTSGKYSVGDEVTAADLFLIPQILNARRNKVDLKPFPLISKIEETCLKLPAFQKAHPSRQPDTPAEST